MALKRVASEANKSSAAAATKKTSTFISHLSGGLSLDFNWRDSNVYAVATEEGNIYRCSKNYQEQYLDTLTAHTGPIYRVQWSPFEDEVFASCGADWASRIWMEDHDKPVFEFQSSKASINDIAWSPHCSAVFGSVSDDGRIEIWDLSLSQQVYSCYTIVL